MCNEIYNIKIYAIRNVKIYEVYNIIPEICKVSYLMNSIFVLMVSAKKKNIDFYLKIIW